MNWRAIGNGLQAPGQCWHQKEREKKERARKCLPSRQNVCFSAPPVIWRWPSLLICRRSPGRSPAWFLLDTHWFDSQAANIWPRYGGWWVESNQGLDKNFSEGLAVHSLIQIYFHQGQCGFKSDHTTPRWLSKMQPRVSLEQNPAPENVALHQKGVLPSAPVLVGRSPLSALHPA